MNKTTINFRTKVALLLVVIGAVLSLGIFQEVIDERDANLLAIGFQARASHFKIKRLQAELEECRKGKP